MDVLNKTVFGNQRKAKLAGLGDGRITLRGPYNNGSMPFTSGGTVTVALKLSSTTIATGDAIVQSIKPTADANDGTNPVMLEVRLEMTGTWTISIT